MSDLTLKYEVSVTVDAAAWEKATGCRPGPYIKELINDLLRAACVNESAMILDVDVRVPEAPKAPKYEEI